MIRVLYFSDAHIEIRQSDESHPWSETRPLGFGPDLRPFVGAVDLLVLAGDIGRIHSTRNVSPLSYAEQAAAFLGSQVILVPGNHEYYRGSFDEDRAALLTATNPGVVVLDRGEMVVRGSSRALRVLGATLWTDYAVTGAREQAMAVAERQLHDHRLIRRGGSDGLSTGWFHLPAKTDTTLEWPAYAAHTHIVSCRKRAAWLLIALASLIVRY
jgi:Calcineurin-like phosphoesterase